MNSSMASKVYTSVLRTRYRNQTRAPWRDILNMLSTEMAKEFRILRTDDGDEARAPWRDLPNELLTKIAKELDILSLLRFRSVCKDWNSASNSVSAEVESSPGKKPWLLSYLEDSNESVLLDRSGKCHRLKTPELNGADCIASRDGWLMVLKNDSIFFFCPFSHAKIELPKLPNAEFSLYLGSFMSSPTSRDCIVSVICQNEASLSDLTLYFIRRGEKAWHCETLKQSLCRKVVMAACFKGKFFFFDNARHCVKFNPSNARWRRYKTRSHSDNPKAKPIPFKVSYGLLDGKEVKMVKEGMKLDGEDDVFVKICGTGFVAGEGDKKMTFVKGIESGDESKGRGHLKGVWIQPRLFSVASDFAW